MSAAIPENRPTRLGTALVIGITMLATLGLVSATGRLGQVAVGAVGALSLAGALLALDHDRFEPVAVALAALVLPLVGASLLVGIGDTVADQFRGQLPLGSSMVVAGATVAVFGAVTAARDALRREIVVRTVKIAITATAVVASVLCVLATLYLTPTGQQVESAFGTAGDVVFDPVAGRVHLGVFLGLVVLAVAGLRAALTGLPVAELLGHRVDAVQRERLRVLERTARYLAAPLLVLAGLLAVVEQLEAPYAGLPAGVTDLLGWLTGSGLVRWVVVLVAAVAWTGALVGWLVRRTYRFAGEDTLVSVAPYASGAAIVIATALFERSIVSTLRQELLVRVPAEARPRFREIAGIVVDFYGERILALTAVVVVLVTAILVLAVLALVLALGVAPRRATGAALASGGVFTTAAFAAVIVGSLPLGLVGVVAGLLVWDAGEFGATLGVEIGTDTPTARTELVHAGGTVLVGVLAGVVALAMSGFTEGLDAGTVPVVPALVLALIGTLLLVVASR